MDSNFPRAHPDEPLPVYPGQRRHQLPLPQEEPVVEPEPDDTTVAPAGDDPDAKEDQTDSDEQPEGTKNAEDATPA